MCGLGLVSLLSSAMETHLNLFCRRGLLGIYTGLLEDEGSPVVSSSSNKLLADTGLAELIVDRFRSV